MQTMPLFDIPSAQTPTTVVRTSPRPPLALGELPVSSVPAAYHRDHLFSPQAKTAAVVDHRPGDLFPPLPEDSREPKAWAAWWRTEAKVSTPDFLGLQAGDDITVVGETAATVVSTCRFGAVVRYALPRSPWATESHAQMYVTARNQFGHWYR